MGRSLVTVVAPVRRAAAALLLAAAAGCAATRPATPGAGSPARPGAPEAPGGSGAAPAAPAASAPAGPAGPAAGPRGSAGAGAASLRGKGRSGVLLVGAWRPVGGGPRGGDAPAVDRQDPAADVVLEFRADGTWAIAGPTYRSRGTYRWVDGEEIELTTAESNLASQVGAVSRRRVTVDATDLALVVETRAEGGRRLDDVVTRYRRSAGR